MNATLRDQILYGGLAGLLVMVLAWFMLGGKRDEITALDASIATLTKDVQKGHALKANYESLRDEVAKQEKIIEALIRILPTPADEQDMPYRMKKLADQAGIEVVDFAKKPPIAKDYYTEYPYTFTCRARFHQLGQFASLVSGYEKIINLDSLMLKKETSPAIFELYPVNVQCNISAFVYNPNTPAPAAEKPSAKPAAGKKEGGD